MKATASAGFPAAKCGGAGPEFNELVEEYKEWEKARRERIEVMIWGNDWKKHKGGHIEGEHFALSGDLREAYVDIDKKRVKMTPAQRAHLYVRRAEYSYENHFKPFLGEKHYEPEVKWEISMWQNTKDLLTAGNRLVGITQDCISTYKARLITVPDRGKDGNLHQSVIFNLALLFIEEYNGFVEGGLPDWYWEGFAHYMEYEEFGDIENNCNDEAAGTEGLMGDQLERRTKMLVRKGRFPRLTEFADLNVAKLTPDMRLVGWSIIDWMHKEFTPRQMEIFVKTLKRTKSQSQAFRDAIGIKYSEVTEIWSEWVLENYR
ncbi:MAG: hypothetical protein U5N86_00030 [Planctomycetota bacterium]|nr:hypothetical protein [Planctomycetota bacterium]